MTHDKRKIITIMIILILITLIGTVAFISLDKKTEINQLKGKISLFNAGNRTTIQLEKNGGEGGDSFLYYDTNNDVTYLDGSYTIPVTEDTRLQIPTREGYLFRGYTISNDEDDTRYVIDETGRVDILKMDSYGKLYARWEKVKTVELGKNGGKEGIDALYVSEEKSHSIYIKDTTGKIIGISNLESKYTPIRSGYKFKGYYDASENRIINEEGILENIESLCENTPSRLVAKWEEAKVISLYSDSIKQTDLYVTNGNIWDGPDCRNKCTKIVPPTKAGYKFLGYNGETSGTSLIKANGELVVAQILKKVLMDKEDDKAIAQWEKEEYIYHEIGLNHDGGEGRDIPLWYAEGHTYLVDHYTSTGYTIEQGKKALDIPTKEGYKFLGYYYEYQRVKHQLIDKNGNFLNENNIMDLIANQVKGNIEITAQWEKVETITFNPNGGTGGTDILYYTSPSEIYTNSQCTSEMTTITVPTRTGYNFKGYYYTHNGTDYAIFSSSGNYAGTNSFASYLFGSIRGEIILTAQWEKEEYSSGNKITLNPNGGTGGTDILYYKSSSELHYPEFYTNPECTSKITTIKVPTRTGYNFKGYYYTHNGTDYAIIVPNGSFAGKSYLYGIKGNIELTAQWEKKEEEVTLVLGDSLGTIQAVEGGDAEAERTGYVGGERIELGIGGNHGKITATSENIQISQTSVDMDETKLTIIPRSTGTTIITVTEDKKNLCIKIELKIEDTSISLSPETGNVKEGGSITSTISGTNMGKLTATSDDEEKATASIKGNTLTVNGIKEGLATITVQEGNGNKTATFKVTVLRWWGIYKKINNSSNIKDIRFKWNKNGNDNSNKRKRRNSKLGE